MSGPWYEEVSMSHTDAKEALFNVFKFKIDDHETLKKFINEVVKESIDLGSYRGYYTFLHTEYKRQVQEKWDYLHRKIDVKPRTEK